MKRIEEYENEIAVKASDYLHRGKGKGILQLCGRNGKGKTLLARKYCKDHEALYFSFRNIDAAFAPRLFIPGCNNWREFFGVVRSMKNRPVIFFDDMDDRDDKDILLEALPKIHMAMEKNLIMIPFGPKSSTEMKANSPLFFHSMTKYHNIFFGVSEDSLMCNLTFGYDISDKSSGGGAHEYS